MSATAIREKRETTLPQDVSEAAGLAPGDRVDWRLEEGEIRGKKLAPQPEPKQIKARLVQRGGALVFETPDIELEPDAIGQAVADERASR